MAKYTFLNLAEDSLRQSGIPMTVEEMWDSAQKNGLATKLGSAGLTPWQSIRARLYMDMKNANSMFEKVGKRPVRFGIKGVTKSSGNLSSPPVLLTKKISFKERQLHPFVAYFSAVYLEGVRCKTILHENSSKKAFSEWLHPDMVGFYFPIGDWKKEVLDLGQRSGANVLTLYSFELKRELNFSNLREAFFQAVSNSSWANEGYLVAANVSRDDEFRAELGRLSSSFGIGVVTLETDDPDASRILFPARHKNEIDWDTVNKLAEINPEFSKFLADVGAVLQTSRVYENEFDKVYSDSEELKKTLE